MIEEAKTKVISRKNRPRRKHITPASSKQQKVYVSPKKLLKSPKKRKHAIPVSTSRAKKAKVIQPTTPGTSQFGKVIMCINFQLLTVL
jgi:phosphopantothenoylcysteine synthetase/decarboxylase